MEFFLVINDDRRWGVLCSIWKDRRIIFLIRFEESDVECRMDLEGPSEIQLECVLVDLLGDCEGSYPSRQEFLGARRKMEILCAEHNLISYLEGVFLGCAHVNDLP